MDSILEKKLTVITTNANKIREIESFLGPVNGIDFEIPEIQSTNAETIIKHKLDYVLSMHNGPVLVEDTGLTIDGMGGLPGPLVKWFLVEMDIKKIVAMARSLGSCKAIARTYLAWGKRIIEDPSSKQHGNDTIKEDIIVTHALTNGVIVEPRGTNGFGWDAIFQAEGSDKTFAEMSLTEKKEYSMREKALISLSQILARRIQ